MVSSSTNFTLQYLGIALTLTGLIANLLSGLWLVCASRLDRYKEGVGPFLQAPFTGYHRLIGDQLLVGSVIVTATAIQIAGVMMTFVA